MTLRHKGLTEKIIAGAFQVYNQLGFGFLEAVYENSLLIELQKEHLAVKQQQPVKVYYEGCEVGHYVADMTVEGKIIVELKSVSSLAKAHEVQLVNYLVATGIEDGLLINFGEKEVEVKRKFKNYKSG